MADQLASDLDADDPDFVAPVPPVDDISVEERARAMGWKGPENFRGDPATFVGAEEFLRKGEEELPILRDRVRRLAEKDVKRDRELDGLRATVEEQKQAIQDAVALARGADDRGYKRGLDDLEAKRREAAEAGDIAGYDDIDKQIKAAQREREATSPPPPPPPPPPAARGGEGQEPETVAFRAANPWMSEKPILARAMIDAHQAIIEREGKAIGVALADQYARARAEVVESFPQFFPASQPRPQEPVVPDPVTPRPRYRAPALDPTNGRQPPRGGGSPFDQITDPAERAEAKAAFERLRKNDPKLTDSEYMQLYTGQVSDVLELMQQRKTA